MNAWDFEIDDDLYFELDDDSDDGDSDDGERRRGRIRPRRIRPGRLGRATSPSPARPGGTGYVTNTQLNAAVARLNKQITANSDGIKRVATQANEITARLGAATARLDKELGEVKKQVKQQGEMAMLMTLMQKAPELESLTIGTTSGTMEAPVVKSKYKQGDNMLPLLLAASMGSNLGGESNMLLFAIAASRS